MESFMDRSSILLISTNDVSVRTRKQEIIEKEYSMLTEDEKRFYQRNLTRKGK